MKNATIYKLAINKVRLQKAHCRQLRKSYLVKNSYWCQSTIDCISLWDKM